MNVCITESLDKKNSPNAERWCRYTPRVAIRQVERCPAREWLAPQEPVVAAERGAVGIGVPAAGVRPEVERVRRLSRADDDSVDDGVWSNSRQDRIRPGASPSSLWTSDERRAMSRQVPGTQQ